MHYHKLCLLCEAFCMNASQKVIGNQLNPVYYNYHAAAPAPLGGMIQVGEHTVTGQYFCLTVHLNLTYPF